jgi:hypothetical protein
MHMQVALHIEARAGLQQLGVRKHTKATAQRAELYWRNSADPSLDCECRSPGEHPATRRTVQNQAYHIIQRKVMHEDRGRDAIYALAWSVYICVHLITAYDFETQ